MTMPIQAEQSWTGRNSLLLGKARGLGLQLPLDLERLAIARGCDYYERNLGSPVPPLDEARFSNDELAIALIVPELSPTAREIRLSAALLGAPDVRVDVVVPLAVQENCTGIVHHIAVCGQRFEPHNPFWASVLAKLPEVLVDADPLPHPTRFVEMTGIDRGKVGVVTRWIRPRMPRSA